MSSEINTHLAEGVEVDVLKLQLLQKRKAGWTSAFMIESPQVAPLDLLSIVLREKS